MVYRQPAPLRCIECRTELVPVGVGDCEFERCSTCGSAWVRRAALQAMVTEMKPGRHLDLTLLSLANGVSCKGSSGLVIRVRRHAAHVKTVAVTGPFIKIGRLSSAAVRLEDTSVSRLHAVIEITEHDARIVDLGSSSGTMVNDKKVSNHELRFGDVIGAGVFELEVFPPIDVAFASSRRRCPQCKESMTSMMIEGVEVESCDNHGLWFDLGELQEVLMASSGE